MVVPPGSVPAELEEYFRNDPWTRLEPVPEIKKKRKHSLQGGTPVVYVYSKSWLKRKNGGKGKDAPTVSLPPVEKEKKDLINLQMKLHARSYDLVRPCTV